MKCFYLLVLIGIPTFASAVKIDHTRKSVPVTIHQNNQCRSLDDYFDRYDPCSKALMSMMSFIASWYNRSFTSQKSFKADFDTATTKE